MIVTSLACGMTPERFDLVITDQTMLHMTGEALVHALQQLCPDVPVIICTGFSHTRTAEKAQTLGINTFGEKLLRRYDRSLLMRRVLTQRLGQPR